MSIDDFSYVWTTGKDDFVLVGDAHDYAIVNKREQSMLLIEDDDLDSAVISRMLDEGCKVYPDINDAYADA